MKLTCINIGATKALTLNKVYELVNEKENRYSIINDKDIQRDYAKNLFKKEEVVKIPVIEDIEIQTLAAIDHGDGTIAINVSTVFAPDIEFSKKFSHLESSESYISCGIGEINGINDFMVFLNDYAKEIKEFVAANSQKFTLSEDIDLEEGFISCISGCVLQDIMDEMAEQYGMMIVSTNIQNNKTMLNEFLDILDEKSDSVVNFLNPNTDNQCKAFSIKLDQ